jgi:hypothetical protein
MTNFTRLFLLLFVSALIVFSFSACAHNTDNSATTATTVVPPPPRQVLRVVARPRQFVDLENQRNETAPVLKILFPANGATVSGALVPVRISLNDSTKPPAGGPAGGDDLIALTLDNEPYIAGHPNKLSPQAAPVLAPVELRNVSDGNHLLRAFVLKPSLETYRNSDAFQMTTFTAGEGKGASAPAAPGGASPVDPSKPLLTFALPNGLKVRTDAAVVIDFYLTNAKLKADGGEYRVRYIIDDDDPQWIDRWEPVWLSGWIEGKHTVRLELVGPDGWPFPNGGYNTVTREISVTNQ